eukprot:5816888-Pyramimonas_sp.AAC.1
MQRNRCQQHTYTGLGRERGPPFLGLQEGLEVTLEGGPCGRLGAESPLSEGTGLLCTMGPVDLWC